jgi:hypothetical protein
MPWSNWKTEDVGIKVAGAPAVSSWKEGRLDVFVRSLFKRIYHRVYENETWQDSHWRDLSDDHNIEVSPAAVSWGPNRIDLFAVWDREVHHRVHHNDAWQPWTENLGGVTNDAPAAASWRTERVDVLVRTLDHFMARRFWESGVTGGWRDWENIGGRLPLLLSAPVAVATGPRRIDCFARGANDRLIHTWYQNGQEGGWAEIDTLPIKDTPAVVSSPTADRGRVDVFVRGTDDLLKHRIYYARLSGDKNIDLPGGWEPGGSWENISANTIAGAPGAVASWSANILKRIDCFAQDANNNLIHTWWT